RRVHWTGRRVRSCARRRRKQGPACGRREAPVNMSTNLRRRRSAVRGGNVHPRTWHATARIALGEVCAPDLDDLVRVGRDPRVMRYIGDGRTLARAEVEERLQRSLRVYDLYPGLGRWYAFRRDTGAFIGWFVLNYVPKTIEVEVGYRLLPAAWGRGFA